MINPVWLSISSNERSYFTRVRELSMSRNASAHERSRFGRAILPRLVSVILSLAVGQSLVADLAYRIAYLRELFEWTGQST